MTLKKLSKCSASIRTISLALIFMFKMFSSQIFTLPRYLASHFGKGTLQRLSKLDTSATQGNQTHSFSKIFESLCALQFNTKSHQVQTLST